MRAMLLAAVLLAGCGEFHTLQYYDVRSGDGGGDDAVVCPRALLPQPEVPLQVTAALHEPFYLPLRATVDAPDVALYWELAGGTLPPGLYLDWEDGTISGFPTLTGHFDLVLAVGANPAFDPCVEGATANLQLDILPGCAADTDCGDGMSPLSATCDGAGLCMVVGDDGLCPADHGTRVAWSEVPRPVDGTGEPWIVTAHEKLTREEQSSPHQQLFSHRLSLRRPDPDAAKTSSLLYRLPDDWPLPFSPGERVIFRTDPDGGADSVVLFAMREDGTHPLVLHNGPLQPQPLAGVCDHPLCELAVSQYHLDCGPLDDSHQCGPRLHDLLRFVAPGEAPVLVTSGQRAALPCAAESMLAAVGACYSHHHSTFNVAECRGLAPAWASFALVPADACPVARIGTTASSVVLGKSAESPTLHFWATESLALDGSPLSYTWSLDQPFPGLVKLKDPTSDGSGHQMALSTPAAGVYSVRLTATDAAGRVSCAADLAQVEARAATTTDLRLELAWRSLDQDSVPAEELELLLMPPAYAKWLGPPPWLAAAWISPMGEKWVCSPDNPTPINWVPKDPEGGPSPELCDAAAGSMAGGRPEVVSVKKLDRGQKSNTYHVAIHSRSENQRPVLATLRVFLNGKPMYEAHNYVVPPGQVRHVGHVDVEFMKFAPNVK